MRPAGRVLVVGVSAFLTGSACGQIVVSGAASAHSFSGQFIVHDRRATGPEAAGFDPGTNHAYVRLEPALLTVSCERIKHLVWRELGETSPWRGKMDLVLYTAKTGQDTITLAAERFKDGWQYRLDVPDVVERARFVRVMTQALLLEMANRNANEHAADVPLWLAEGSAETLLSSSEIEVLLPPPRDTVNGLQLTSAVVSRLKQNPLMQVHALLSAHTPLTFEELSWPKEEQLAEADALYRGCSQLFVSELMRLNGGRACLRAMLAQLPRNYNWQFAFLEAFRAYFARPLDVEKWWALQLVQFTGRDPSRTWPLRESLERLDQSLHSSVQVRAEANGLPLHTEATLQTIIREWDRPRQTQALFGKLKELELLRLRVAPEVAGLVEEYHQTLETYLQKRDHTGSVLPFTRKPGLRRLVDETVAQLDALDIERRALRPPSAPVAAAPDQRTIRRQ